MSKRTWQEKMLGTKEWKVEKTDKDFADMPNGSINITLNIFIR